MIKLTLGPMFAGKSTELKRLYEIHRHAQRRIKVIKYAKDDRYNTDSITTHNGVTIDAINCINLMHANIDPKDVDVIIIDEIQFYPDNIEFCEFMANAGVIIEAAGLVSNSNRETFARMGDFVAKVDEVRFFKAVCMRCFNDNASFTYRKITNTEEEVIGGHDMYMPLCRACYNKMPVM